LKAVHESVQDPLRYYKNNVSGSITLLEVMQNFDCQQLVFSSSATVYGEPKYLPYDELHPTSPVNPYGETKLMIEKIISDWCKSKLERAAISLRYFNPVGAHPSGLIGEDPKSIPNNLMPVITKVAAKKIKELKIYGSDYRTKDGTCERDFIHVCDLASAHVAAVKKLKPGLEVINLGTGVAVSVLQLLETFQRVNDIVIPSKESRRRAGDLPSFWANPQKAYDFLNWKAEISLENICRDGWRWQNINPEGFLT